MSGPEYPDAAPPEVPEEFAAAYLAAYRRSLESAAEPDPPVRPDPAPDQPPGTPAEDALTPMPPRSGRAGTRWLRPAAIGTAALVLVLVAYGVGSALSHGDSGPDGAASPSASRTRPTGPPSSSAGTEPSTSPGSWDGAVAPVRVDAVSADCTAPPGIDSAGRPVTYGPGNAIDGADQTAWRCPGTAVGQRITLRLAADTDVAEVGLVPGYAKTDPASGADRYAENNRITRVRWTLGDGVRIVQRLDPDPGLRSVQSLRVPATTTDTITLEILAVRKGPRNTTAISEVRIASAQHE